MAMQDNIGGSAPRSSLLNDPVFRGIIYQVVVALLVVGFISWLVLNTAANLAAQNKTTGFDLLFRTAGFDIARRITAAYGARLVPVPFGPVAPGVELLPLPGHTPGQGGYLFTPAAARPSPLLILADALHLAIQAEDPDIGLVYDLDPARAAATRRAILARAAAEGWTVAGAHLPGFARVVPSGAGFRLAPA